MLTLERLQEIVAGFPRLTIALVGDLFLDRYLEIDSAADEPSIETGLTAYQIVRVRNSPGALGTVMNNLAALGVGRLLPVTVLGDDGHGYDLCKELERLPIDPQFLVHDSARLTPTYTKPLRSNEQGEWFELNRLDVRTRGPLTAAAETAVLRHVEAVFAEADGVIVLDQVNETNWGVVNQTVRARLQELSDSFPDKLVLVDSRNHLGEFFFGVLKGNRAEVTRASKSCGAEAPNVEDAVLTLARRTGRPAYVTVGEEGIMVARPDGWLRHSPGVPVTGPIDVVGAGDSATAALVASLLAGANEHEAAEIACLVASITVQQLGTTGVATPDQVIARRQQLPAN